MTLCLSNKGIATSYATVAVGEVGNEKSNAERAVQARRDSDQKYAEGLGKPEIVHLLGQADVAMLVETADFKYIFDLRYPRMASHAAAVNWVFSVPYVVARLKPDQRPGDGDPLRFILHLRLRRHVYAYANAEEEIVNRLAELLDVHQKGARIHAGLGWSDLIVDGHFTRDTFEKMARFIIDAHGLKFRIAGKTIPVLQRMLTVIGYSGEPPRFGNSEHLTFLRAVPGSYDAVEPLLRDLGTAFILDGKADFLVRSKPDAPETWLKDQQALGEEENRARLQKVETHLMYFPAEQFTHASADERLIIDIDGQILHRDKCGCSDHSGAWIGLFEETIAKLDDRSLLPKEERYAIDNTLFILGATLRDQSICCDARDAINACYQGLMAILMAIADKGDEMTPERSRAFATVDEIVHDRRNHWGGIVALWARLDEWHRFADLLLRQRTVGSYEEILGQTDRSVVYSGGVQKFLYLADRLINEFARRVARRIRPAYQYEPPPFTIVYDSVKTVLSARTGLVRVPTRNIFNLARVVPDLWHEVGAALFLTIYAEDVARRLAHEPSPTEFISHLADHYGDLLVYLYGFGGDFSKFLASIANGWHDTYRGVESILEIGVQHLLGRVYLVYEFHELREARRKKDETRLALYAAGEPTELATDLIDELKSRFRTEVEPRYAALAIGWGGWHKLWENVTFQTFSDFQRKLYGQLIDEQVESFAPNLQAFEKGELRSFTSSDDMNVWFSMLAHYMQAPNRSEDIPLFRMMASLTKSAGNEFHRRQISRTERDAV